MKSLFQPTLWSHFEWHWHGSALHSTLYRELTLALLIILFLLFAAVGLNV